jgi:hypothetical protein
MRLLKMKHIWGLFCVEEYRLLKLVFMASESGISFTHQPMDTLYKELPGLVA